MFIIFDLLLIVHSIFYVGRLQWFFVNLLMGCYQQNHELQKVIMFSQHCFIIIIIIICNILMDIIKQKY